MFRKRPTLVNFDGILRALLAHSMGVGSAGYYLPPNVPLSAAPTFTAMPSGLPGLGYSMLPQQNLLANVSASATPFTPQQSLPTQQSDLATTITLSPTFAERNSPSAVLDSFDFDDNKSEKSELIGDPSMKPDSSRCLACKQRGEGEEDKCPVR